MQEFNYQIEGKHVYFYCLNADTRNGFKHTAYCEIDGWFSGRATCHYYNRTWERYTYETVCKRIARQQIERCTNKELAAFKRARGYQRMTEKRRAEFAQWQESHDEAGRGFWEQVYSAIENYGRSRTLAA